MHRPCTNASSAISGSRTSNWTNCAPGCAAPDRYSGWPSTLAPRFFPYFIWVLAHNTWRTYSSTRCDRAWPPFWLPLFTSDGLNLYFYALTAHFGQWLKLGRRWCKRRRWKLEWWRAYYHFVRPHESQRVRLEQPRERGGERLAQHYRQRTPAMAAGRRTDDGRRARCSFAPCRRFPLESHVSQRRGPCHVAGRLLKVPAASREWSLTSG